MRAGRGRCQSATVDFVKEVLKHLAPAWLLDAYRRVWKRIHARRALQRIPAAARELYRRSALTIYPNRLAPDDESARQEVMAAAREIYGEQWNYYSDALRPEIVEGFVATIDGLPLPRPVSYLEIGSAQGLSMSLIALLLSRRGKLGELFSLDPYFESGYDEGELGPYAHKNRVTIGKKTRDQAQALYARLALDVTHIEKPSEDGLKESIAAGKTYDLIYIDGYHETLVPTVDFGLSYAVLARPGVIILDDHLWPDVAPLKALCDRHATRIQETWKTASYLIR